MHGDVRTGSALCSPVPNQNPKHNPNLLSYQGVGIICKRFMLMTTIKVQKPGNIGTGEHRHRGTSVPGNIGTGKHRYAPVRTAQRALFR